MVIDFGLFTKIMHAISVSWHRIIFFSTKITVACFNPSEKYAQVKLDHFPQGAGVKIKNTT